MSSWCNSCQSQSKLSRGLWVLWVNTPVLWRVWSHTTTLPAPKTRQDIFSTTSAHSYRQLIVTQLHQNHPALKVSMIIAHREHHWCLVLVCISYVKLCIFCIWCWLYKTPFWLSQSMLTSCSFCYRKHTAAAAAAAAAAAVTAAAVTAE